MQNNQKIQPQNMYFYHKIYLRVCRVREVSLSGLKQNNLSRPQRDSLHVPAKVDQVVTHFLQHVKSTELRLTAAVPRT